MARCSRNACRRWRPTTAVRALGLGLHVDSAWFCSDRCVAAAAEQRLREIGARTTELVSPALRLGQILTQQRKLTSGDLAKALESQRASGRRLGRELLHLGLVTREALLGALAAQSNSRYLATIDTATVRSAPGGLSADEVRALGVVPFGETKGRLMVACAAPMPNVALDAMVVLIGRPVDPFLVDDDDLVRLQAAYGSQATTISTWMAKDVVDGAARIAEVAAKAGAVDVKEARVDPYTWVRIDANGRVSTLLVPPSPVTPEEIDPWPVATTRH